MENQIELNSTVEVLVDCEPQQVSKGSTGIVKRFVYNSEEEIIGAEIDCNGKLSAFLIHEIKLI